MSESQGGNLPKIRKRAEEGENNERKSGETSP